LARAFVVKRAAPRASSTSWRLYSNAATTNAANTECMLISARLADFYHTLK
jgi:hypothetical protein